MSFDSRQLRIVALLFTVVVAILAILWFSFLRTNFVPAYQNIRQSDASAIVNELEAAGIPYRLENEGHDILVSEEQASEARVAVAGSSIAIGGTVGFELFNDSDMGLTEFAQKINFQRAMQGELSRTIMMMEGVEFARVHLALPERSIFRAADGTPTAAVTLETIPGMQLTPQRVAGVQQLVASSVPGLSTLDVAILDKNGDIVSNVGIFGDGGMDDTTGEHGALEAFYALKARRAITEFIPGLRFDLDLDARSVTPLSSQPVDNEDTPSIRRLPELDGLALGIIIRTPQVLGKEERLAIENALEEALGLGADSRDRVSYTTGVLAGASPAASSLRETEAVAATGSSAAATGGWSISSDLSDLMSSRWALIVLCLFGLAALAIWPRRRLAKEEAESFADLLKSAANDRKGASDA